MNDIGAMGRIEERQDTEAEIDQHEPKDEREEPQRQSNCSKFAQIDSDAQNVRPGDHRKEGENQAWIDEIGPNLSPEANEAQDCEDNQPGISDQIGGEQRI